MTTARTTRRFRAGGWFSLALCLGLTFAAIASWDSRADPRSSSLGVPQGFSDPQTDQNNPGRFRIVADGVVEDGATGIRRNVPNIKMGHAGERALATLDEPSPDHDLRSDLRNGQGPRPTTLRIGSIGVNAGVVPIGVDETRALVVPRRADITGWWSGGFIPGENGPTVIVGHFDSKVAAGVFERLKDTKKGARITVEQSDGSVFVYQTVLVERLSKTTFPTDQVYGTTPTSTLRLVTCGGKFDSSTGHYVDNVILYADLVAFKAKVVVPDDPDKLAPLLGMRTTTTTSSTTTTSTTSTTSSTTTTSTTSSTTTTTTTRSTTTTTTTPTTTTAPATTALQGTVTSVRPPSSGPPPANSAPSTETVPNAASTTTVAARPPPSAEATPAPPPE